MIGADGVDTDRRSAGRIVALCDGLPLAIHAIGARIAAKPHWSLASVACRLVDGPNRLDELSHSDLDVRSRLTRAERGLSVTATVLLRRLALIDDGAIPSWAAGALLGVEATVADTLLEQLVDSWLLVAEAGANGKVVFRLPPLVRLYAADRLLAEESAESRRAALHRLRDVVDASTIVTSTWTPLRPRGPFAVPLDRESLLPG